MAPIALYPDPLLSQTLVASTYPLEVVQLQQWLAQNKDLKDKALADAVKKQDWDPSIQGLAALPDVVKLLSDNIKWTTDLGNAFLAQQNDVMDAVQRMRKKAQDAGNLKSSEQQKVETKTVESKQVIVVEQANPQVVYVPSYNPTVVYGAPVYAYPPIAYPPPGYYAAGMAISFGVGVAMGAMWGGGWGYNCGWGGNNNVTINNNNNFVNNSNRQSTAATATTSTAATGGNSNWQHNPQHRGGAPYGDRGTANKYGGTARGDSMQIRQSNARQNQARQQPSAGNRDMSNRGAGPSAGTRDAGNRGGASAGNMNSNRGTGSRPRRQPAGSEHPKLHQPKRIRRSRQRHERQPGPRQQLTRLFQHGRLSRRWRFPWRWWRRTAQVGRQIMMSEELMKSRMLITKSGLRRSPSSWLACAACCR